MATSRSQLIDQTAPLHYHLISRCVRRSFLCGYDKLTKRNYDHRRDWIVERLTQLTKSFAVAIESYAIMSNHFHLVIYYDPLDCHRWSDEEVANRWLAAFPVKCSDTQKQHIQHAFHKQILLSDPDRLAHARSTLGSVSMFMKYLKQPIAYRANREDDCTGHFFESRFYSGAIVDEPSLIASMAYVDLNPVRAKIVEKFEDYSHASSSQRLLVNSASGLRDFIKPIFSGVSTPRPTLSYTLSGYLEILRGCESRYTDPDAPEDEYVWFARVASVEKRQRAFGLADNLKAWCASRGWSSSGSPLPAFSR